MFPIMKLKELGGGWACLRTPSPPPPPSALRPQKDSPVYLTARTRGGTPRPAALQLLVKSCVSQLQTPSCRAGASPGFRVADVHLLQVGKLGLGGARRTQSLPEPGGAELHPAPARRLAFPQCPPHFVTIGGSRAQSWGTSGRTK